MPYGQAIRIKKICSDEENLNERLSELESWLEKRGYLSKNVKPEIKRVHSVSRAELLKKVQKQNDCSEVVFSINIPPSFKLHS